MGFSPRKGDRVESIRWPGHHGSVTDRAGHRVFVRWDATTFIEEAALDELKNSRRPAPKTQRPHHHRVRDNQKET